MINFRSTLHWNQLSQISIWEVQIHSLNLPQHLKTTTKQNRKAHILKWKLSSREENHNSQTEVIRSGLPGSQPATGFAEVIDIYGCHWNQWELSFLFHWKKIAVIERDDICWVHGKWPMFRDAWFVTKKKTYPLLDNLWETDTKGKDTSRSHRRLYPSLWTLRILNPTK